DVWFKFTAERVNPNFTIAGYNNTVFNSPRIQLFTGTPGSFVQVACNTLNYTANNLTVGQEYYVRIYSMSGAYVPNANNSPTFTLCVNNAARPVNDECSGATSLTQGTSCTSIGGNLVHASASATAVPGDCGNAGSPDVWYSFTATSPYPLINVTNAGAQLTSSGLRVQLFSGVCGALTSLVCNSPYNAQNNLQTYPTDVPLIVGATYYIRVYSNGSTVSANTWGFNICVQQTPDPVIHYGKTYTNITKGAGGGTIEPGDILEMRAVVNLRANAMFNARFNDNIPANTTYIPGTLRILTNEGMIFRQFTDAIDGDGSQILGSAVSIGLGRGATSTRGGTVKTADRPIISGGSIMVVSYRIRVNTVSFGTQIQMGGGSVNYDLPNGTPTAINYNPTPATVYQNYGICTNTIGSNGILSEFGGTFGSGTTKDRAASPNVPTNYGYTPFTTGQPGDYNYGISNNTSANNGANYSINPNDPVTGNRVFGFWDILGDHTGASDPLQGNLPADVNNGATGGYMVVINASYRADTAFQDTVRNLCPNTSYEYSAWFRNVCRRCGVDSTGVGYTNPAYVPTGPGDTSGVHPNLTFNINGSDYYTTGDILYTGQWIKKGFTYRTGPSETQMVINIRNNAPGGGGNDWAIDDIGVSTCSPTLVLNPATPTVNVCYGDGQSMAAQVVSYYDNFTHWIWERSVDSGTTWATTGFAGNSAPTFNGTEYEYTATGPSIIGDSSTHKSMYRLRVASTTANLADPNCSFRAIRTIQVLVNYCMYVLKTKVSVNGILENSYGIIDWKSSNEETGVLYTIERSTDGTHYTAVGTVHGKALKGFGEKYRFVDPSQLKAPTYYRIAVKENNTTEYTKVILLSPVAVGFDVKNVLNPFDSQVSFDVIAPAEGSVKVSILDNFGRVVKSFNQSVYKGVTAVKLSNQDVLANGVYALKVEYGNVSVVKRMVKVSQ
ncbi:MAG: T9SS type A sorting domain-containing protein, partial [Flavitalea sp.]